MLSLGAQGSLVKMVALFGQSLTSEEKGGRDSTHGDRLTSLGKEVGRQGGLKKQQHVDKTGRQIWSQIKESFEL